MQEASLLHSAETVSEENHTGKLPLVQRHVNYAVHKCKPNSTAIHSNVNST